MVTHHSNPKNIDDVFLRSYLERYFTVFGCLATRHYCRISPFCYI